MMEFCSRRLGNRAEESPLAVHPPPGGAEGFEDRRVPPGRWCTFWVKEARQAPSRSQRRCSAAWGTRPGLEEVTCPEDPAPAHRKLASRQQLLQKKLRG